MGGTGAPLAPGSLPLRSPSGLAPACAFDDGEAEDTIGTGGTSETGPDAGSPVALNALGLSSGWGITVHDSFWLTERTAVVAISTDAIDPRTVDGPLKIRVTLPGN